MRSLSKSQYQHFNKKGCLFRSLLKIGFCTYFRKYQNLSKRYFSLDLFEKKLLVNMCKETQGKRFRFSLKIAFAHIAENINISKKRKLFWDHLMLRFLPISPKISKLKLLFSLDLFKKLVHSYVQKYQYFQENYVILRPFGKCHFCSYIWKYQHL